MKLLTAACVACVFSALAGCGESDPSPKPVESPPKKEQSLEALSKRLDIPFPPGATLFRVFDREVGLDVIMRCPQSLDELVAFFSPVLDAQVGARFKRRTPDLKDDWARRDLHGKVIRMASYYEPGDSHRVGVTLIDEKNEELRQVTVARLRLN